MKYQVQLTAKAERDVDQVLRWFRQQQATAAGGRWLAQLLTRLEVLERAPQRCRLADEADDLGLDLRELLFGKRRGKYRILFVIRDNIVGIVHIRHAARDALSADDIQ